MLSIKKLLCAIVLFTMQSNFCMEDQERKSRVEVLDDGHEWMIIENEEDFEPYAGNLVACRSHRLDLDRHQYSEGPDLYVFINRHHNPVDGSSYYADYYRKGSLIKFPLRRVWDIAGEDPIAIVRLLTRKELRYFKDHLNKTSRHRDDSLFTFGNLMEKERRPYFWERANKKAWPQQRLLHIGAKEPGSAFSGAPREMVRKIAWHLIGAETNEMMAKAKLDDLLVLE